MDEKILILGANGQLGKEISESFSNLNTSAYTKKDCDLLDNKSLLNVLNKCNPKIVINCAAYTKVDEAEDNVEQSQQVNSYAVGEIAKYCKDNQSLLIHYSTDYVFDGIKSAPYSEQEATNPINAYGESKLIGENLIKQFHNKFYIFRTSWVYGIYGNNFPKTILNLLKTKNSFQVVNDQIGVPTSTRFIAHLTKLFVKDYLTGNNNEYGVYNLVPNGNSSWYQVASFILNFCKKNNIEIKSNEIISCKSTEFPTKAKRPAYSLLSNDKINQLYKSEIKDWEFYLEDFLKLECVYE